MEVEWLQNFDNERRDSVWYGGDIVRITTGRYTLTIGAYGDIRAFINDEYYVDKCNGGNFIDYLREQGIHNDKELKQAIKENRIEWEDNNWYEAFIWDNKEKCYVECYDTVLDDDLDLNDNFAWVKSWVKELCGQ